MRNTEVRGFERLRRTPRHTRAIEYLPLGGPSPCRRRLAIGALRAGAFITALFAFGCEYLIDSRTYESSGVGVGAGGALGGAGGSVGNIGGAPNGGGGPGGGTCTDFVFSALNATDVSSCFEEEGQHAGNVMKLDETGYVIEPGTNEYWFEEFTAPTLWRRAPVEGDFALRVTVAVNRIETSGGAGGGGAGGSGGDGGGGGGGDVACIDQTTECTAGAVSWIPHGAFNGASIIARRTDAAEWMLADYGPMGQESCRSDPFPYNSFGNLLWTKNHGPEHAAGDFLPSDASEMQLLLCRAGTHFFAYRRIGGEAPQLFANAAHADLDGDLQLGLTAHMYTSTCAERVRGTFIDAELCETDLDEQNPESCLEVFGW